MVREDREEYSEFQYPISITELNVPVKCGICHRPITLEQIQSGQAEETVIPSIKKFEGGFEDLVSGEGFISGRDTYLYKHTRCVQGLKKRSDRAFLKELKRMKASGQINQQEYQEMLSETGLDKTLLDKLMDK